MVRLKEEGSVRAKIIDLGLAKTLDESASEAGISSPGVFAGTPEFASPEQFAGVQVDIRSDLYSFGVTLWEMLIGRVPFRGSPSELMYQHQHAPLPIEQVKGLPQPVVALLEVLLEKDPARRLQSPVELLNALPEVTDAVKARRTITHQRLREIADQRLGAAGKAIEILTNLIDDIAVRRVRVIIWATLVLVVGGGAILTVAILFGPKSAAPPAFRSSSPAITAPEKSIAVLPFENISANKDDAYFADGVQDEILNNLAKIAQLKVISRTSVMQYRTDAKHDLREIAAALGVANVLEGTVRRDGNHVRVSTELIDAHDDNTVWADSYDRDLTNIFAIQSEIAQTVASKLSAKLSPEERKDIEQKPTNNLEAYDLYLQAKQLIPRESSILVLASSERADFSKGLALLEEATRKDPNFALGYCLIAKAHDFLYSDLLDHTPERRALGDAAVNEALRLRPDLPEVHLAAAFHSYACYKDFERARVQLAIAAQSLSNSPDLLELTALIDQVQGRWKEATTGLEKVVTLDPRNPELLELLADHYENLQRYRDADRIEDRLIELEPDQPLFLLYKTLRAFYEKGVLKPVRAAFEALPSSAKNDVFITIQRIYYAKCDRDFKTAHELVSKSPNEEIFFAGAIVPRQCADIWLEMVQGNHPTMEEFGVTREQVSRKVAADPTNAALLSSLACVDIGLGRKEEAVSEGKRATEMVPISKDAIQGPGLVYNLALVYAWADEPDLAFEQLSILIKVPNNCQLTYGTLKVDPSWDPLRKDPRFEKFLAELAPRE